MLIVSHTFTVKTKQSQTSISIPDKLLSLPCELLNVVISNQIQRNSYINSNGSLDKYEVTSSKVSLSIGSIMLLSGNNTSYSESFGFSSPYFSFLSGL